MIELKIKTGVKLQYDEGNDVVLVDGKRNRDWEPVFILSGDDEPDFYGFGNIKNKKLYSLSGGIINVKDKKDINLD